MRIKILVFAISLLLSSTCSARTPQTPSGASNGPQRDPQALSLIQVVLAAYGGSSAWSGIGEISASGNVTFHWADVDVAGTFILKANGASQLRLDATVPNGNPIWVVNGGAGKFTDLAGMSHVISSSDAWSFASLLTPIKFLADAAADSRIGLKYTGLVDHGGKQLQEIEIRGHKTDAVPSLVLDFNRRIYIDPSTNQIQSVVDETWPHGGGAAKILHEIRYSNFQTVQGLTLPFSISDYVAGQNTFDLQVTQISATSSVTDSDFGVD